MIKLIEITLDKLRDSTEKTFPDTTKRQHKTDTVGIRNIKFIPYVKSKALKIETTAISGPKQYKCSMMFSDVYYEQSESSQVVSFTGSDGNSYYVHPLSMGGNDVKVKCTCMDFYYRFAQSNFQYDGLDGNPPPTYVKKTDRPLANPEQSPGMCKHLLKMQDQLEKIELIH